MPENTAKHYLLVLIALTAAVACYAAGFALGLGLFLGLGIVLELSFWVLLLSGSRRKSGADTRSS